MKNTKRVRLTGNSNYNNICSIVRETKAYFILSLQNVETLERHDRAFSKKTLKCRSNTSEFTKNCKIISFL
tara:strand:+ start:143 stop:355 length:213 start_codon:yes stop_codon:yes gene_type:complete